MQGNSLCIHSITNTVLFDGTLVRNIRCVLRISFHYLYIHTQAIPSVKTVVAASSGSPALLLLPCYLFVQCVSYNFINSFVLRPLLRHPPDRRLLIDEGVDNDLTAILAHWSPSLGRPMTGLVDRGATGLLIVCRGKPGINCR